MFSVNLLLDSHTHLTYWSVLCSAFTLLQAISKMCVEFKCSMFSETEIELWKTSFFCLAASGILVIIWTLSLPLTNYLQYASFRAAQTTAVSNVRNDSSKCLSCSTVVVCGSEPHVFKSARDFSIKLRTFQIAVCVQEDAHILEWRFGTCHNICICIGLASATLSA